MEWFKYGNQGWYWGCESNKWIHGANKRSVQADRHGEGTGVVQNEGCQNKEDQVYQALINSFNTILN